MLILLSFLFGSLAGYYFGRRYGIKEGRELEESYGPLSMRKKSLQEGRCLTCGASLDCHKTSSMLE